MKRTITILSLATLLLSSACATSGADPNQKAKRGAAVGAVVGAVAGAIIGNQGGNNQAGAVVGAVVGGAIGGAVGHNMDKQEEELRQIPGVEVSRPSETEIEVKMTSDVLFDYDSAALRPESRDTLRDLAQNFAKYPDNVIEVDGHTDSMGSDDYNQRLSDRRADAVSAYLIDQGVPSSQISARGFGEMEPKATNDTPEGRQLNRRVEIHIRAPRQ